MTIFAYLYWEPWLEQPNPIPASGIVIDRIYEDWGERHQLEQLLQDCQTQPPDTLLLRSLSELGDSLAQISDRLQLCQQLGITIISHQDKYHSHQDPQQTHLRQLLAAIPDHLQRRRLRQGHGHNRLQNLPPPGKAPYGYRRGQERYLLDRSTAPVVKDFFERFLLYGSLRGAVRYLEKRYGKKIAVSTGRNWLLSPVYRGDLIYHNQQVIPNTHTPIISREEAAQVDRLLRRNRQLPPRTASAPRSLAGLVVCQQCQSPMTVTRVTRRGSAQEYLYLRPRCCPNQPKCSAIPYQEVLTTTIARICLDLPLAVAQLETANLPGPKKTLQTELNRLESLVEQINSLEAQGVLDSETAQLRRYKLLTTIAKTRDQLAALPPVNLVAIAQTASLPQFWLDLSEAERRFYFREFIRQIEILRSTAGQWQLRLLFIF